MIHFKSLLKLGLLVVALALCSGMSAKKIICIDDNGNVNDGFLNGHEGWERQEAGPDDVIVKGGSLTDCLAQAESGDTIVIVAHGVNGGEGFKWGGTVYEDFGDGEGEMPVPENFDEKCVHIKFCSCWSARDPDGDGDDEPLTEKLKDKAKAGSTAEGFTDLSESRICWTWTGGSAAQCKAVGDSLSKNGDWIKKPPHNRPDAPAANDKACAQAIADAMAGGVTIGISYYHPVNVADGTEDTTSDSDGGTAGGCGCDDDCGLFSAMSADDVNPPSIDTPFNFPFPSGLWRSDEILEFVNPGSLPFEWIWRNLRLYDPLGQTYLGTGDEPVLFTTDLQAFLQISPDGGETWMEIDGFGFIQGQAFPVPLPPSEPHAYYDIFIEAMTLDFPGGFSGPIQLQLNPLVPSQGVSSVESVGGSFFVDSFFDIAYQLTDAGGEVSNQCGSSRVYLHSQEPCAGCTDMDSPSFDGCATSDDGSCSSAMAGCTYAAASNYNPNATQENGSCIFHGCTDPTADNYDATANADNGSCSFASLCPADNNGDQVVNTEDLLITLGFFGTTCD